MDISSISSGAMLPVGLHESAARTESRAEEFSKVIRHFLGDVNLQQINADQAVERLIVGETDDMNEVMLALSKADLTFRMFMDIRDKVIDAYQEVMRMQL